MLKKIEKVLVPIRFDLTVSKNIKFGIEIEAEGRDILSELYKVSKPECLSVNTNKDAWLLKSDLTVPNGAEISSPILTFSDSKWDELLEVCNFFSENGLNPGEHTGLHIHLSSEDFLQDKYDLYNLLKFYAVYESVLYLFGTGEYVNYRTQIYDRGALPMAYDIWRLFGRKAYHELVNDKLLPFLNFTYFKGLRLTNLLGSKETIEFRMANGSLNLAIIQNFVNVYTHVFSYVLSDEYDDDLITRKFRELKHLNFNPHVENYLNTSLEDLLEFADLIFDNELDKLYFLRQCIKEPVKPGYGLQKAKTFYKKNL